METPFPLPLPMTPRTNGANRFSLTPPVGARWSGNLHSTPENRYL